MGLSQSFNGAALTHAPVKKKKEIKIKTIRIFNWLMIYFKILNSNIFYFYLTKFFKFFYFFSSREHCNYKI